MEYAAMTFWLLVIVFSALGVHRLWSALLQPKIVNSILLPGTLVATLGHILGLLITGGTVDNTTLITDDDSGEPQTGTDPKPRVPIIGAVIIALLPMVGCAAAIYAVAHYFGTPILQGLAEQFKPQLHLPTSYPLFFEMLRQVLTLVERLITVVLDSDLTDWRTLLFLYLAICLTVRMAPLTGDLRGSLGAIFVTGIIAFLMSRLTESAGNTVASTWPLISFSVAVLLFLLMVSLLITGAVNLARTVFGK